MPTIGRFLTTETIQLGLSGLIAGSAVGVVWRLAGRSRWGVTPFLLAVLIAAGHAGRSDWPEWNATTAAGVVVLGCAATGAASLLADPAVRWGWVAAGSLVSAAGIWVGVPETGPALLAAGGLAGLAGAAAVSRAHWGPGAGVGMAAVLGWAALSGAAGQSWAALGGTLCAGAAPWLGLRRLSARPHEGRSRSPRPWLLGAHLALVILSARWIGVDPHAGWGRAAVLAAAGVAVAMLAGGGHDGGDA